MLSRALKIAAPTKWRLHASSAALNGVETCGLAGVTCGPKRSPRAHYSKRRAAARVLLGTECRQVRRCRGDAGLTHQSLEHHRGQDGERGRAAETDQGAANAKRGQGRHG